MNVRCEMDGNKVILKNRHVQSRLANLVIQASLNNNVKTSASRGPLRFNQEGEKNQISRETMEEIEKQMKEQEINYNKLKKINEERMRKILAPPFDPRKCSCHRPTKSVLCVACSFFWKGRKAIQCNVHASTNYLSDFKTCPVCLSTQYLTEKDINVVYRSV